MKHSRPTRSGYTLMELVVVLALIAIAAAVVTPTAARAFSTLQLRMAASSVSSLCAQARSHAVYESRSYRLLAGPREEMPRTLYLVRDDGKTVQHLALPNGIAFVAVADEGWTEEAPPIVFFADGTSQPARWELRGARDARVQLALNGLTARVRVSAMYRGSALEEQP
jgi:prepilin-type N-terminal cleavage/methylation domain-containing protein